LGTIRLVCDLIILFAVSLFCTDSMAEARRWQILDEGLYLGKFPPLVKSHISNFPITIVKINPEFYSFKLLCASEHDGNMRTAKKWCNEFGLLAAINASMYQDTDPLKSTGYMKNYNHINNPHINTAFGAFMAFNPIDSSLPEPRFVDRRLQKDWKDQIEKYHTVVQNYRMISKGKRKGWPQQKKLYSTAAVGMDKDNNVLFIHSPSPYSTHDCIAHHFGQGLGSPDKGRLHQKGSGHALFKRRSCCYQLVHLHLCHSHGPFTSSKPGLLHQSTCQCFIGGCVSKGETAALASFGGVFGSGWHIQSDGQLRHVTMDLPDIGIQFYSEGTQ